MVERPNLIVDDHPETGSIGGCFAAVAATRELHTEHMQSDEARTLG